MAGGHLVARRPRWGAGVWGRDSRFLPVPRVAGWWQSLGDGGGRQRACGAPCHTVRQTNDAFLSPLPCRRPTRHHPRPPPPRGAPDAGPPGRLRVRGAWDALTAARSPQGPHAGPHGYPTCHRAWAAHGPQGGAGEPSRLDRGRRHRQERGEVTPGPIGHAPDSAVRRPGRCPLGIRVSHRRQACLQVSCFH